MEEWVKQGNVNVLDSEGRTLLSTFVSTENEGEVVDFLLEHGADVNAMDKVVGGPLTALYLAVSNGKVETAKKLISHGANVNAECADGWTALHAACRGIEVAEVLLDAGATVRNILTEDGTSELHIAVKHGNEKAVKALLEHGANPLLKDSCGNKPSEMYKWWEEDYGYEPFYLPPEWRRKEITSNLRLAEDKQKLLDERTKLEKDLGASVKAGKKTKI